MAPRSEPSTLVGAREAVGRRRRLTSSSSSNHKLAAAENGAIPPAILRCEACRDSLAKHARSSAQGRNSALAAGPETEFDSRNRSAAAVALPG